MENVAIFGAAGAIGRAVGAELERRGIPFRAVGRSRPKLDQAFGKRANAEIFPADLSEARAAGAAARGGDTIIYCVGLPYPSHQLHPLLMRTTLEAGERGVCGVFSGLGAAGGLVGRVGAARRGRGENPPAGAAHAQREVSQGTGG